MKYFPPPHPSSFLEPKSSYIYISHYSEQNCHLITDIAGEKRTFACDFKHVHFLKIAIGTGRRDIVVGLFFFLCVIQVSLQNDDGNDDIYKCAATGLFETCPELTGSH